MRFNLISCNLLKVRNRQVLRLGFLAYRCILYALLTFLLVDPIITTTRYRENTVADPGEGPGGACSPLIFRPN